MAIRIKRVYEPAFSEDGARILVDRLWPRGISKEKLALTAWMKEIAPSNSLRTRFHHDLSERDAFKSLYFQELAANPAATEAILAYAQQGTLTLLFAARDPVNNNAAVLKEYLEKLSQ
jgi:uncharacterized protein YeaO (DUF488 family)